MITFYSYEELSETVQNNIYEREMQTTAYEKYRQDFLQESLLERLNNHYTFRQLDNKTIAITDEETDITYTIEVTMSRHKVLHIAINNPITGYYFDKAIQTFYNDFYSVLDSIRNDLEELEPDFAQYLQYYVFTEEGKKVKISIDN